MKRIFSACILLIAVFGLAAAANAEQLIVEKDTLTDKYTISGQIDEAASTGKVSLLAVSENGDIVHVTNIDTDEHGTFSYYFMMPPEAPSGRYIVKVSAYGKAQPLSAVMDDYYVSEERKAEVLEHINTSVSSSDALKAYLSNSVLRELGLVWPSGMKLSDKAKTEIFTELYNNKPYSSVRDIREVFYSKTGECALSEATPSNIESVWEQYSAYYDLSGASMYDKYNGYSDADKKAAIRRIANSSIKMREDIVTAFDASVFLFELSQTKSYSDVNEIFRVYGDAVTFDLSTFSVLESVLRGTELYGKSFANMTDLKRAIENIQPSSSKSTSGGGGSSGGGSSGGSGSRGGAGYGVPVTGNNNAQPGNISAQRFTDVSKSFWAYDAIEKLSAKGIINGYSDNSFLPDKNITREEFISIMVRFLGISIGDKSCSFEDVPKDRWSYGYIAAAFSGGIVQGFSDDIFGAEELLTRQDMAVIVARAFGLADGAYEDNDFIDAALISDYAAGSVKALKQRKIINGFDDNSFRPLDFTTRAEASMIMNNISKGE